MSARILLVEDHGALGLAVADALKRRLFVVDLVRRIDEARAALSLGGPYDAVILDRRLPDGEGATLVPDLLRIVPRPRLVFLTAHDAVSDRIEGLDLGADDYLVKPFEMEELAARLRAVLRRPEPTSAAVSCVGRITLDPVSLVVTVAGAPLDLPRRELHILAALMRAAGRPVLRDALMNGVYGLDSDVQPNALEGHLSRLRARLRQLQAGVEIRVVRGVGYRIVEGACGA
jgi:DNA-binding response OmpR family regulator